MRAATYKVSDALTLDARRAAWLPRERVLAVADLHLGYAWAHRLSGQLMPILPTNDTLVRLRELQEDYNPAEIVVVGDVVHRAMALDVLQDEIRELFNSLSPRSQLTLVAGNHDRELARLLREWLLPMQLLPVRRCDEFVFIHGDVSAAKPAGPGGPAGISRELDSPGRIIMGHEHPAISIGDGVTTSQKCPCFLISDTVVVLPAFSRWAAGTNIRAYPFNSEIARNADFNRAIAVCGDRLLPIRI